ncbi:hypothetical protein C1645_758911, partial [Glomus cerebriforme]
MVGKFYEKGFGIDKDENIALEWYVKASQQNDIYGHFEVGRYYYTKKNYDEAFKCYQLAANNGLNVALNNLAGMEKDDFKIFELYKKSAENGFLPSQYELAKCYENGKGTQQNKTEALKWYKLHRLMYL